MTRRHRPTESFRSIAGGALVGLGLHILSGNVDNAASQLRLLVGNHPGGATGGEGLGVLPSAVLASSQAAQAYAFDHQGFLLGLLWMLISFWPLLLVIVGTILLRNAFTDKVKALPTPSQYFQRNAFKNKTFKNSATGCRFQCPSFDA
jgi:hypothetical protein